MIMLSWRCLILSVLVIDRISATQVFINSISADCSSFSVTIDDPSTLLSVPEFCIGFEIDESQDAICDQEHFPMTCEFRLKELANVLLEAKETADDLAADCSSFSFTIENPSTQFSDIHVPNSCNGFEIDESQHVICDQKDFPMTCEYQLKPETAFVSESKMYQHLLPADCSSFSVTIDDLSTLLSVPQSCIGFEIDESQEPICDQEHFPMTCQFQLKELANVLLEANETADGLAATQVFIDSISADCSSFSVTIDDPSTLLSVPESCIGFEIDESQDAICDQEHFPMTCEFQLTKELANVLLEANETAFVSVSSCDPGCVPKCQQCWEKGFCFACKCHCYSKRMMLEGTAGTAGFGGC